MIYSVTNISPLIGASVEADKETLLCDDSGRLLHRTTLAGEEPIG